MAYSSVHYHGVTWWHAGRYGAKEGAESPITYKQQEVECITLNESWAYVRPRSLTPQWHTSNKTTPTLTRSHFLIVPLPSGDIFFQTTTPPFTCPMMCSGVWSQESVRTPDSGCLDLSPLFKLIIRQLFFNHTSSSLPMGFCEILRLLSTSNEMIQT